MEELQAEHSRQAEEYDSLQRKQHTCPATEVEEVVAALDLKERTLEQLSANLRAANAELSKARKAWADAELATARAEFAEASRKKLEPAVLKFGKALKADLVAAAQQYEQAAAEVRAEGVAIEGPPIQAEIHEKIMEFVAREVGRAFGLKVLPPRAAADKPRKQAAV